MKNADPSGIGMTLLMGDSEAILRVLSTSSSSGSNWPSSSSTQPNTTPTKLKFEKKRKRKNIIGGAKFFLKFTCFVRRKWKRSSLGALAFPFLCLIMTRCLVLDCCWAPVGSTRLRWVLRTPDRCTFCPLQHFWGNIQEYERPIFVFMTYPWGK